MQTIQQQQNEKKPTRHLLWTFALLSALATLAVTALRVPGVNLMLEQQQNDSGSASALINFFGMITASIGVYLISLNPNNLIPVLGVIQVASGLIGGSLWFLIRNKAFVKCNF